MLIPPSEVSVGLSGTSLQLADRQVSGEHRLAGITRQTRVGFRRHLGAITGLFKLQHVVAIGYAIGGASPRLCELRVELADNSYQDR